MLQELNVPSCASDGLATGTGTDQIAIATRIDGAPLTGAGKHTRLGELIARSVQTALREALARQNGLSPASRCSTLALLRRLGAHEESLSAAIRAQLSDDDAHLLACNLQVVLNDPPTVAAVAALLHLRDQFVWGVLPQSCLPEVFASAAAQLAAAVAGQPHRFPAYREALEHPTPAINPPATIELLARALALGFREKWVR